jgi:pimeloyl-ACP methyl ester carboxylesterase
MLKSALETPVPVASNHLSELWRAVKYLGIGMLLVLIVFGVAFYARPLWIADMGIDMGLTVDGIHSEYAQVGPYRVHYYVGGHGTPLLLIHGLGSRSEDWAIAMPMFARSGFRVYAIDLLGCGRTDHPDIEYSVQQQADMVHQFLNVMHIQRADVAGWSLGGWIALKLAQDYPQMVQRLVLYDSAGLVFHAKFGPDVFTPKNKAQLMRLYGLLTPHPKELPNFVAQDILRRLSKNYWVIDRTVASGLRGKDLMTGKLDSIHVPVLIAWGAEDALIPPDTAIEMHRQIPQSVLEFYAGCGHIAPAQCADRVIPNTVKFLQSRPPMAGDTLNY